MSKLRPDIAAVVTFLEPFQQAGFTAGEWSAKEGYFPSFNYNSLVVDFCSVLYDNGWVDKKFDWTSWRGAKKFVESPEQVKVADETTIRRLFTTHLRQDRFCEGHLVAMFENGHIVALLQRLAELAAPEVHSVNSIFSTYSTGENRVTASLLAVLRSLALSHIQLLLGALLERSEFELVRFENQPAKGGKGVPDAIIHASLRLLVETKIERNSINIKQISRHLERLDEANEALKLLLVITPDDSAPAKLESLEDERIVWTSFAALDQAINEMLDYKYAVVSEREAFLLRELQNMLVAEGLLTGKNDIVVVAARNAWPEYQEIDAYVCQPNRPFQRVDRLAFYSKGLIHPLVPKIIERHDEVVMAHDPKKQLPIDSPPSQPVERLVKRLLAEKRREEGEVFKVLLLSAPDSPDTLKLPAPIPNDLKSESGKPTAFTMGHRYTASEKLLAARTTSDLSYA